MRYREGITTALLLVVSSIWGVTNAAAEDLRSLYKEAKTGEYAAPYAEDLALAQQLFHRTLTEAWNSELQVAWSSLGFEFFDHRERGETFGVLRERGDLTQGRGFYVFREAPVNAKMLQIPHGYSDLYTGTLGVNLMLEGNFQVAAWNTVPRAELDLAHTEASFFNALTQAFGSLSPSGNTLQIHGFAQGKRTSLAGQQADVIVSNGTLVADDSVQTLDACLTRGTDYTVLSYPEEVQELGGTTNDQGKALRLLGNHGFVHVEMSYPFRKAATRRKSLRSTLSTCLESV